MLVFRSFALGLLGTCVLLLAVRPPYEVHFIPMTRGAPTSVVTTTAAIIDVAPGVRPSQLAALVHLDVDEHVTAVDDQPVRDDLEAGSRIAAVTWPSHRFVDLTVAGTSGARRVLVLLH